MVVDAVVQVDNLVHSDSRSSDEAYEEHHRTEKTEHVHGLLAKGAEEPQSEQIEVAVDKTVQSHELGAAVFASLVVHHLLAYLAEAGVLCQIWYVAVHLAVDLNVLDHILAVGFQAAVEVVQVWYSAYLACRGIEKLCRNGLRQWVVAFLLVARNEVEAVLGNHLVESGNLVGGVLQVGIHRYDYVALGLFEAAVKRGTLSVVAAELYSPYFWVVFLKFFDDVP